MPHLIIPPVASITSYPLVQWIDPGAGTRSLSYEVSPNLHMIAEAGGMGGVTIEAASDKVPYAAGDLLRHLAVQAGKIDLPILVREATYGDLMVKMRAVRSWFRTGNERSRTPGYLRVTTPDGVVRQLACYYTGGLETPARRGPNWAIYTISLYAPDPYPTDIAETTATYTTADIPGQTIIINTGDLEAYPIWRINGPGSSISFTFITPTPDEAVSLQYGTGVVLTAGQWVEIDTRPASIRPGIQWYDQGGISIRPKVDPNSVPFWLLPGENRINWSITGMTGASSVTLRYLRRYEGLLY